MGITEFLATYVTLFIAKTWYITVFLGMVMESMILPIPSEAVMPFAGFLVATGEFNIRLVVLIATLGTLVWSLLSYAIWFYGGHHFINKRGKYFLLDEEEMEMTESFFKKRGEITIFVSRFIPVVRHLISIPAGMGKMHLKKFIIYTVIGGGIWNTFLALLGKYLKENWSQVMKYSHIIDIVILVLLVLLFVVFIVRQVKKWKRIKSR